ncbi:MAG: hypothetical protein M1834_007530 [Cirrosporium novae-zelandiae]|nr:MAG: hypothetical protein M1834_007530 [Cirrosporium novae-zelandiae]
MGLHAPRREALIKVDDGDYSLGQVMKFAAHRNSKTLVGHYLDDMNNVDGAAGSHKRLPLCVYEEELGSPALTSSKRQKLIDEELANYRRIQRVHTTQFPERDRLARILPPAVPLRSPEGISAFRDLIALRTNNPHVAYQEVLRLVGGHCPVSTCGEDIQDIDVKDRWEHIYRCSKAYHEKSSGFAEFCFRCTALQMKQFPDRTSWQRHNSVCTPDYVKSLDSKDSIPCPHLLCAAVLHSESDLWNHIGDIHSTYKSDAGKKRQRQREESEDEQAETSGAATTKRRRFQEKLEDEDSKAPGDRKSTPEGRSKEPLGHTFVNILATNFDPGPADVVEIVAVSSGSSSHRSTPVGSVWDNHDDYWRELSLPWTISLEVATVDLFGDSEPWNFDAIADAISSPIESQEDWILSSPNIPPSNLSSVPMKLINPGLQDALPSSTPSPPATTDSVEDALETIPTHRPGHIESTVTQQLRGSQGVGDQPAAIDAKGGIWEAESLLAKWKQGKTTWFLVKWKGFPYGENTWEKRKEYYIAHAFQERTKYGGVELFHNRESPNGKFGFQAPTYHGTLRQDNSWTDSWENFFAHALQRSFDIEQSVNGTSSEITGLCDSLFKSVIPSLLGPLQNQSRKLKPCLNHGDLWSGNFALDSATHRIIFFDACSFWGHNEYDLAEWGPSRSKFDYCILETYHKWIPVSPPEDQ